jgi:hypothetical protein
VEEDVRRGAVAVDLRSSGDPDDTALEREVSIRRRDADRPDPNRSTVDADRDGKAAGPREDPGQGARRPGRRMEHREDRRSERVGQSLGDRRERLDAAGRGADHDDVAPLREGVVPSGRLHVLLLVGSR